MKAGHHPSDETLQAIAAGTLANGPALVVAAHLAGCPDCRAAIGHFEAVGGALIDVLPPTSMSADALDRALAAIEREEAEPVRRPQPARRATIDGIALPGPLSAADVGGWHWLGPGIRFSRVRMADAPDANIILLRVAPNTRIPEHGHTGTEFTHVLQGTLCDGARRYLPGDLMEAGAELEHEPCAGPEGDCICLAAVDGKLRLNSFLGRLIQPFVGI